MYHTPKTLKIVIPQALIKILQSNTTDHSILMTINQYKAIITSNYHPGININNSDTAIKTSNHQPTETKS
jgi:hypothetical protein